MNFRLLAAPRNSGVKYWELPIFFDSYEFSAVGGTQDKLIEWIRLGYIRPTKDKERRVARAFYTPTPLIANLHKKLRRSLYQMEVVGVEWLKLSLSKTALWRLAPAGYIKRVEMPSDTPPMVCFVLEKSLHTLGEKRTDPWHPRGKFVNLNGRCALTGYFTDNIVKNNYHLKLDG